MTSAVEDAVQDLQRPGMDVTFTSGDRSATIRDPRALCEELAEHVRDAADPATEPWPHDAEGEPEEYVRSELVGEVAARLINGIVRFRHLRSARVDYLFRNKDAWSRNGATVHGQMKRATGLVKSYSEADFIVLVRWQSWEAMNPMQRVALVYHELRHGGEKNKIAPHDFEGFFDELELFGTGTYREWNRLAQASEAGSHVAHQYTLSVLDG